MAENELQKLIKRIFNHIKEKYGYTDEQALIYLQGYQDCAEENQQSHERRDKMLRDTVAELCEAKRLLKAAIKDIGDMSRYCLGMCCDSCPQIHTLSRGHQSCIWQHEEAALKLIGETNDEP